MAFREDVDYQELINKAVEQGDYRAAAQYEQSRNEKIGALNAAGGGTNQYGAEVTNNYRQYLMPENYTGSSYGVGVHTADQTAIRDQMNSNSIAWWSADDATRAQLEQQNQQLAGQLGSGVTFDEASGYWSGTADKPKSTSAPTFDYSYYEQSQPTFESSYSQRIDDLLNQILNRDSFSYNAEEDPLYQQYRSTYQREGDRAMNDTLAAAASSAGGMNSYALSAAQQAQNYYGAQLGDKIPELYQLAYQMYLNDIDLQMQDMGLLQQMDDTQYGRYRDTMSDWRDDRDFAYGAYRDDMGDYQWNQNFEYNAGRDFVNDSRYDDEIAYDREQSARDDAYDRAITFLNSGVMPDSSVLQAAGISSAEAERILAAQQLDAKSGGSTGGSGTGSGGGGGGNPGAKYTGDADAMQALYRAAQSSGIPIQTYIANHYKEYGFTSSSGLADGYAEWEETQDAEPTVEEDEGGAELNWNSATDLGIGPVSASYLLELKNAGAIIEDGNGNVYWAPGWDAKNYKARLRGAGSPVNGLMAGLF